MEEYSETIRLKLNDRKVLIYKNFGVILLDNLMIHILLEMLQKN